MHDSACDSLATDVMWTRHMQHLVSLVLGNVSSYLIDRVQYTYMLKLTCVDQGHQCRLDPHFVSMASHSDELMRLVHDLQTMRKLPLREDYPSVSLSQLFDYIETHGPIVHPVLGEMSRFLSYEREFLPLPTDVPGRHEVVARIHKDLSNWRKYQRIRGYIVLEQCGKTMDETIVRMPNVSFLPTDDARGLQNIWMCDGDPFAPTFVVEVNTLRGPNSQFDALDAKMRHEYFTHGV